MRKLVIFLSVFCCLHATDATAQSLDVYELEPFYVVARDVGTPPGVLQGEQWRSRGVVGLAELLEDVEPGLALVRKAGMSNDVVLRGLGGDDVSVTLDGRKIYCACSNRMDPPLSHATAENAAAVDVAAGPFSLRRSGSLGGHINVVSEPIESGRHGAVEVRYGSFGSVAASTWGSAGTEALAARVQAAWLSSDPYENGDGVRLTDFPRGLAAYLDDAKDDKAYEAWHAGWETTWQLTEHLRLSADYLRREDKDVLFPGLKMDADLTKTNRFGLRLESKASTGFLETWTADAYFNETRHLMSDRRRLSSRQGMGGKARPAPVLERGWFMETDAASSNYGCTLDAELAGGWFEEWAAGGEFDRRRWDSDNVIGMIGNDMLPDVDLDTYGIYTELGFEVREDWRLELGARLDRFEASAAGDVSFLETRRGGAGDAGFIEPSGYFSLRRELGGGGALFAGIGSVARSPNPQELYIQVRKPNLLHWIGNPKLDPPRSNELTGGVEYERDKVSFRARVFHSWLDDYIYPVAVESPVAGESLMQSYDNIDARLYGCELSCSYELNPQWSLEGAMAWQRGEKRSRPDNSGNDNLAEIPPLRMQFGLSYTGRQTEADLELRASQGQSRVDADLKEKNQGSWVTVSARMRHQLNAHWSLALAVENLFDTTYALHNAQVRNPFSAFTVVDEPGRTVKATLRYEF